ncbi:unnamed protein product, partial [Ascophyllum nodosum]
LLLVGVDTRANETPLGTTNKHNTQKNKQYHFSYDEALQQHLSSWRLLCCKLSSRPWRRLDSLRWRQLEL